MAKSECSLYSRMFTRKMWPFPALCAEIHIICPRLILICKARPIRAQFESVNNLRTLLILVAISILVHNLRLRAFNETKCGVSKVIHCQQAFDPNTKLWKNQLNQALASVVDLEMCVLLYSLSLCLDSLCMKISREIGQRIPVVKVGQGQKLSKRFCWHWRIWQNTYVFPVCWCYVDTM